jgi:hypothetical protein
MTLEEADLVPNAILYFALEDKRKMRKVLFN